MNTLKIPPTTEIKPRAPSSGVCCSNHRTTHTCFTASCKFLHIHSSKYRHVSYDNIIWQLWKKSTWTGCTQRFCNLRLANSHEMFFVTIFIRQVKYSNYKFPLIYKWSSKYWSFLRSVWTVVKYPFPPFMSNHGAREVRIGKCEYVRRYREKEI